MEHTQPTAEAEVVSVKNEKLTAALDYARRGWPVLPLHCPTRDCGCSCNEPTCGSPGKHPLTKHGVKEATISESIIRDWWTKWPTANVGIRTGTVSGLVVIDVDDPRAMERVAAHGYIPNTLRVTTGKGLHLYFAAPPEALRPRTAILPNVDVRAEDSYVVGPPSIHTNGKRYEFVRHDASVEALPGWLLEMISSPSRASLPTPKIAEGVFTEGERNTRLTKVGGSLVRQGISGEPLEAILKATNEEACRPPLDHHEIERVARSVERYARPDASIAVPRLADEAARPRFKLFTVSEVLNEPSPQWRVEDLLPVGAFSMIYSPPGQMKTFFGLDIGLSVAHGIAFHGRQVLAGPVIYVLGEGRGGLKNRVCAWLKHHELTDVERARFVFEAVQFKVPEDVRLLKDRINGENLKPAMLFIDTFARSAVGVDENDAKEIGVWIDAIASLQQELTIDVVAIHHSQKGRVTVRKPTKVRERGSSAFIGAVDTAIRLHRDKPTSKTVEISCEKQKDAEEFEKFTLGVKVVPLGFDEHGKAMSSCVLVEPRDIPIDLPEAVDDADTPSGSALFALQVLVAHEPLKSGAWRERIGEHRGKPVKEKTFDNWRAALERPALIEEVGENSHVYRATAIGHAIATANGTPLSLMQDPTPASHATTPEGVAGGRGQADGLGTGPSTPPSNSNLAQGNSSGHEDGHGAA